MTTLPPVTQGCGMCGVSVATVCVICFQKQTAEVERLRAALKKYGEHAMSCVMRTGDGCICDLDDVLGEKTLPDDD